MDLASHIHALFENRANQSDAVLRVGDDEVLALTVLTLEGEETLGRLFEFHVVVAIEEVLADALTEDAFVSERAALHLTASGGRRRVIRGMISDGRFLKLGHGHVYLSLRLSPLAWPLTQRINSRIFQEEATPAIIRAVLADHGLGADGLHFALRETYAPRDYCVQYRESDWDFISRLMEEEGLYHFYRDVDGTPTLHITDGAHGHFDLDFGVATRFHAPEGMRAEPDTVHEFGYRRVIKPGRVVQTDYAARKPRMPLETQARRAAARIEDGLEVFDFPGEYRDKALGERLSRVRLEGLRTGHVEGRGRSTRMDFGPGRRVRLEEHPLRRYNAEYVLTTVRHRANTPMAKQLGFAPPQADGGARPAYENEFVLIPADEAFRPARSTRQPRVSGPQTAIVVGPREKEIHTDELGRVKVRFHWDRERQLAADGRDRHEASCWIRVSQPWAGVGYGGLTIPRIGQEVIVDFLEGDPDQPIITGRVYNGEARQPQSLAAPMRKTGDGEKPIPAMQGRPQTLPASATRTSIRTSSTPGGGGANEITLDDAAGAELFHMNATKDGVRTVGNNDTTTVANNREISVGVDLDEYVGSNRSRRVGANESVTVDANQDITVKANRSVTVEANETHTVNLCRAKSVMISENQLTGVSKTVETGLAHVETVGLLHALLVGLQRFGVVGMNDTLVVGANKSDQVFGNFTMSAGNEFGIAAGSRLVIACPDITLKGKGGFIRIDGNGVTIKGEPVKINCAGAEAGELSTSLSLPGAASGGSSGSAGGAASGAAGGGAGGASGGLGGVITDALEGIGLDIDDLDILNELGLDENSPWRDVLAKIGDVLPKIPGLDPDIAEILGGVLQNGRPSVDAILDAAKSQLPDDAKKVVNAIEEAIRNFETPPTLAGDRPAGMPAAGAGQHNYWPADASATNDRQAAATPGAGGNPAAQDSADATGAPAALEADAADHAARDAGAAAAERDAQAGRTDYAAGAYKDGNIGNKCSQYVHDKLEEAGFDPPDRYCGRWDKLTREPSCGPTVQELADGRMADGTDLSERFPPVRTPKRGDVILFPFGGQGGPGATGHTGIVTSYDPATGRGTYVGAGSERVNSVEFNTNGDPDDRNRNIPPQFVRPTRPAGE